MHMAAQKLRALHERAGLRVGRPWFPHRANRGNSDPFCADHGGNVALRARIGYTGRARPPLGDGVGASHRILRLVAGARVARSGS